MGFRYMFVAFALSLFLPLVIFASSSYKLDVHRTVDLQAGGRLELESVKGSVLLEAWDRDQVEVVAEIAAVTAKDDAAARAAVDATEIDVVQENGVVRIRSNHDRLPSAAQGESEVTPAVHYRIHAPRHLALRLTDRKSDLRVRGFEGEIDITQQKGLLAGEDLKGSVAVEKLKGDVSLSGLRGSFDIVSQKGNVTLSAASIDGRSRVETGKGDIELRIPDSLRLDVVARAAGPGALRSDFALESAGPFKNRLQGQVNGGGPEVSLDSGGRVHLRRID